MLIEAVFVMLLFTLNATFVTGTIHVKVAMLLSTICPVASIIWQYTCPPFISEDTTPVIVEELPLG